MKKVRMRMLLIFLLGLLTALCGISAERDYLCIIGLLIMFASMIYHVIFYRCPYCGVYLDRNKGEYCPHCGNRLCEEPETKAAEDRTEI